MQVGADTGGTFTDLVAADGRSAKVLSTPDDPGRAVAAGLGALDGLDAGAGAGRRPELLAHGTTVATNALLERRGAPVALVTTEGLADVIEIGRQDRPSLYDQLASRPEPLVPRDRRYEVPGRLAADGSELRPVDPGAVPALAAPAGPEGPDGPGAAAGPGGAAGAGAAGDRGGAAGSGGAAGPEEAGAAGDPAGPEDPGAAGDPAGSGGAGGLGGAAGPEDPGAAGAPAGSGGAGREAGAVAVCLLHADLDPRHERAVADALRAQGRDVTCSHEVSPEMREYERTVTTVINASLIPISRAYLHGLTGLAEEVVVMTSAGGLLPVAEAAELPAALLLSGPAGGVRAGAAVAVANGYPDAVTFDMGGTSTDVCLIVDGAPAPAAERRVAGYPVRFPSLDVHTIGAGGGSIARVDPGGALVVGPQSAGADPGPACYGRGGTDATVTDANLVAGRIPADAAFGGLRLDRAAAVAALARAGVSAEGVLAVVDANMERALRAVSVERGVDPRGLALVAFGGAGPLHACALADAVGMPAVIVPARAGVLSAVGLLTAPRRRDLVRSWPSPDEHAGLDTARADLAASAAALLADGGDDVSVDTALDCRYRGQSHELTVPSVEAFHEAHRRRNGYARPDHPVEVVAIRATAVRPPAVAIEDLPPVERAVSADGSPVLGPRVLAEPDCTIWVAEGWVAEPGAAGAIVLRRAGDR